LAYNLKLTMFEGPFDLLFHLLDKNEIDIYDIPIAKITEQYVEHINQMQLLDLEVTSEFLVMAAKLLSIKAKMLLPKPPKEEDSNQEEIDPREELVLRLLEYRRYKEVSEILKNREVSQGQIYTRPNEEEMFLELFKEDNPLEGVKITDLLFALRDVLNRVVEEDIPPEMPKEDYTLRDKMGVILRRLIFHPNGMPFKDVFNQQTIKIEVIVTFMALLELIKLKKISIRQSSLFGEITLFSRREENLENEGVTENGGDV